jgi:hypothetical protein
LFGGGLIAFAGCSSSGSSVISVTHPTMIRVEPEDFLGTVPCDLSGSGLKRYVATIVDYDYSAGGAGGEGGATLDAPGFQAPSSLPTPCTTGVGFGFVVPGRHYQVFIDGYDRDDIAPRALGSREMVPLEATLDPTGDVAVHTLKLEPRWRTSCRQAIATDSTIVRASDCDTFQGPDDLEADGTVSVALSPLLGELQCGSAPDEVESFKVTGKLPDGTELEQDVACPGAHAPPAVAVFSDVPGRTKLSLYVQAFSADSNAGAPLAGAQCNAVARAEANVEASCAALSQIGTVQLDVAAALQQLDLSCSADSVSNVTLKAGGDPEEDASPPDCLAPFVHGFAASAEAVTITLTATTSEPSGEVSLDCHATVEPGRLVQATCP